MSRATDLGDVDLRVSPVNRRSGFLQLAVLLLTSGLTFFPFLGRAPIVRVQEVRVLETAREMGVTGGSISPRFCGELRLEKPPLAYWLAWAGFLVRGEPDEAAGRLYSAIAGTLTVLLLHAFGRAMGRPWLGTWAGLMLATSFLFYRVSRRAEADVLLACAVTAAFYCFFRTLGVTGPTAHGPARFWAVLGWGAIAIGFLAKGPAALLLPLISVAIYVALGRQWSKLAVLFNPWGIVVFFLLALPWCLEVMRREGLALEVFVREMQRTAEGDNHRKEGRSEEHT